MIEIGLLDLENLPSSWVVTTLDDVFCIIGGGTPSTKSNEYWTGCIPWISSSDITDSKINVSKKINSKAIRNSSTNIVPKGSIIVVTRVGLGKVAMAKTRMCFSQDCQALVNKTKNYSPAYVMRYMSFAGQVFKSQSQGTTISGITKKQLKTFPLPLPPLPEQHRIVEKIETLFSELDSGVKSLKAAKAQLKRYRQSVLKSAFEGKLTEAWRREHADELESAESLLERIKAEREAAYEKKLDEWKEAVKAWEANGKEGKKPAKPKKLKDFSPYSTEDEKQFTAIPKEWQRVKLEWLGEVQLGRQRSPKHVSNKYPTKYIRAANITEHGISTSDILDMEFTPDEFKRYVMKNDDIVVAEASGSPDQVGKPAIWKGQIENCCFQNTVIRLRPFIRMSKYIFWHLKYLYMSGALAKLAGGVGINHLSAGTFSSIVSPICSLAEQHQIVNEIESRLSQADAMEKTIDESLEKAERLRQSILKKAFEGKLVPQDENDESASELLNRIKAGKS